MEYRPGELARVQQVSLSVFKEFIRICEKYHLDYFAHWGTALGAVRHGGFIPWDDDIDVGMLRDDYELFLQVAPGELGDRFVLSNGFIQKNCPGMFTMMSAANTLHVTEQESLWGYQHGIRMDIFPFDYVPEDEGKRRRQFSAVRTWYQIYIMKNLSRPMIPGDGIKARAIRGICRVMHVLLKALPMGVILWRIRKASLRYRGQGDLVTLLYDIHPEKYMLRLSDIFPLQDGVFEGIKVKLMAHDHMALQNSYGDYWELPPEDQRVNHYSGRLRFDESDEINETDDQAGR